jgi:hypothetical protein
MARRPVKKRKARKTFKIVAVKAKRLRKPVFKLQIGSLNDPLYIDPKSIPHGIALQWTSADSDIPLGWEPVPNVGVIQLNRLIWATIEVAEEERAANIGRARKQMADAAALFGLDEYGRKLSHQYGFPFVSPSFMVSTQYATVPADSLPIDVDIAIKVRASVRWQDAAACLGLTVQEYVRRRLLMEPSVLGPIDFNENAYEPVTLSITRKD